MPTCIRYYYGVMKFRIVKVVTNGFVPAVGEIPSQKSKTRADDEHNDTF